MTYSDLSDVLRADSGRFETRRKLLVFEDLIYKPTGEKLEEGFRYFNCEAGRLLDAFNRRDFAAIAALDFAVDEEGDPDTSAVLLNVTYTASGALFAAQPVEYQRHNPTPIAEALLLEGEEARQLLAIARRLDQSS